MRLHLTNLTGGYHMDYIQTLNGKSTLTLMTRSYQLVDLAKLPTSYILDYPDSNSNKFFKVHYCLGETSEKGSSSSSHNCTFGN